MHSESVQDLEREAMAAIAGAPPEADPAPAPVGQPSPTGPTEAEVLAGYEMVCTQLIGSGCNAILPAWQVTPSEVSKLSTACSKALMLWFPDMIIPPKYMALIVIAGVGFEIAQVRRDPETGRYRPARVPERSATSEQTAAH